LTQRAGNRGKNLTAVNTAPRQDYGGDLSTIKTAGEDPEAVGFFGNLVRNAVRKKANELTDGLLKKNNKNLSKFKI